MRKQCVTFDIKRFQIVQLYLLMYWVVLIHNQSILGHNLLSSTQKLSQTVGLPTLRFSQTEPNYHRLGLSGHRYFAHCQGRRPRVQTVPECHSKRLHTAGHDQTLLLHFRRKYNVFFSIIFGIFSTLITRSIHAVNFLYSYSGAVARVTRHVT